MINLQKTFRQTLAMVVLSATMQPHLHEHGLHGRVIRRKPFPYSHHKIQDQIEWRAKCVLSAAAKNIFIC